MGRGINQKGDQEVGNKLAMTVKTLEVDFNPKMSQSGFIQVVVTHPPPLGTVYIPCPVKHSSKI